MIENSTNYGSYMSHAVARDFALFLNTMNMGSQVFAEDGGVNTDVQTSATTIQAVLNGVPFIVPKDDVLDVSADLQLSAWLAGESYTAYHMRYVMNPNSGLKVYYKCILAHTSAAANKPDEDNLRDDATWKTYWTRSTQTAEAATGTIVPTLNSAYFVALITKDGTLTLVRGGDVALDADAELVMPNFEPEMFVAIGTLHINAGVGGFVLGDDDINTGVVGTFVQLIGPTFPTGKAIDQN
jgi:hypothetical protein